MRMLRKRVDIPKWIKKIKTKTYGRVLRLHILKEESDKTIMLVWSHTKKTENATIRKVDGYNFK